MTVEWMPVRVRTRARTWVTFCKRALLTGSEVLELAFAPPPPTPPNPPNPNPLSAAASSMVCRSPSSAKSAI